MLHNSWKGEDKLELKARARERDADKEERQQSLRLKRERASKGKMDPEKKERKTARIGNEEIEAGQAIYQVLLRRGSSCLEGLER